MRTCVIFNPTAKGGRARDFRRHLGDIAGRCSLRQTGAVGDARGLASDAVREGFEVIVAAGGDGTLNEVLNGIGDVPHGFDQVRLGVLPLGTVNVFARELGIPRRLEPAWKAILQAHEVRIDLPLLEFQNQRVTQRRHFAQLAGAGLDARAIELVRWPLKQRLGPLAYVLAGLQALLQTPSTITVTAGQLNMTGEMVLIGNGQLYGGPFKLLPAADNRDGLLDFCVFPRANWLTLARCSIPLLARNRLPASATRRFQAASVEMTSAAATPLEVDGELIGHLPAKFSLLRLALRVIVP